MIEYIVASKADVELFMQSRLEMLKVVNDEGMVLTLREEPA